MSGLSALRQRISRRFGWKKAVFVSALLVSSAVIAGMSPKDDDDDNYGHERRHGKPLQILWTNDTHGFFLPVYHAEYNEIDTYAGIAASEGKVGGYAQIAGLVNKLKEGRWGRSTLFVDAGDTFDGSPVAQMTRGDAVWPILNAMGYDAWTPGNRDFAWANGNFASVTGKLTFPTVCANLLKDGNPVFPPYITKEVDGLKVAMIGLTSLAGIGSGTPQPPGTPPEYTVLGGDEPGTLLEDTISALAAEIRANENPDVVVVLSHLGYYQDKKLASRTTGIDVIVGAHTHHNVKKAPVISNADGSRSVIVAQAGSHGKYLGRLKLWVKDGKVVHFNNKLIRVSERNLRELDVKPDPYVESLAQQAYAPFKTMLDEVIGYTTTVLERRGDTQSTMTNFLTDAIAARYGVDGSRFPGIRYGSSNIPGPITVGDVWNIVSPNFGNNRIYRYTLTGGAIANNITTNLNTEYGSDPYKWNGGDVFRYNSRVKYTFNADVSNSKHLVDLSITTAAGETVALVTDGVPQSGPNNLGKVFTFAGTVPLPGATGAAPVPGVTAVDEIVAYIKSRPNATISPVIDDRAVQLDTAPTNIADIE